MPALEEGEVEEEPSEDEDPLPKKLQNSVVRSIKVNMVHLEHCWSDFLTWLFFFFLERDTDL